MSQKQLSERENSISNDQPAIAGGNDGPEGDGNEGGGGLDLPIPSMTQKQLAVLAVLVVVVVAVVLHSRSSDSPTTETTTTTETDDESGSTEPETDDGKILVPEGTDDPLAGDEVIIEEFRKRGRISDGPSEE